jgi:tetratricopeptide (TPR) repeat protein
MKAKGIFEFLIIFILIINAPINLEGMNNGGEPQDSVECKKEFSIFTENMKTKNYEFALPAFRYLLLNCPGQGTGLYIRGEELLTNIINNTKDEIKKKGYVDTLLMLLDQRMEIAKTNNKFGKEGFILGKKATFLSLYRKDDNQLIYDLAKKSVELEQSASAASVMSTYMQYTSKLNTQGKLTCDDVINTYNVLSEYIDINLKAFEGKDSVKYNNNMKAQENVDKLAGSCLTCDNLVDILKRSFENNKDNATWVKRTVDALDRKKCMKEEKYRNEKVVISLFEQNIIYNPSADGHKKLARIYVILGEMDKAQVNYEKAIELEGQNEDKAQLYMELASTQADKGQYSQARQSARMAAKMRENWGRPYIFIGDLYAGSASRCTAGNACEDRSVFWAAVDKYNYAKSIDPACAEDANKKIGISAANYPGKDDCFFYGIKEGQSYSVGCWIGESTTVRIK